jgi:hypothetical protein
LPLFLQQFRCEALSHALPQIVPRTLRPLTLRPLRYHHLR